MTLSIYMYKWFNVINKTTFPGKINNDLVIPFLQQIHPSRKYFAVAEKGVKPNINIFEYPSLKLHRILRDGTEEAYAHLDFSPKGDKLASVGSAPDYMLTVWDWKNEQVILRSKAFSQDVYKVAFSPEDEGHLCTSGSGHIRYVKTTCIMCVYTPILHMCIIQKHTPC